MTATRWPMVALGEVLRHRKEFIEIDDDTIYMRPRVQVAARGVTLRDRVPGSMIKTKSQQVCNAGEFLVAEIDAKAGGFGLVPPFLDGSIVSSHYFLFQIDEKSALPRFIEWYSRSPDFLGQVSAKGSTNYAAIRPSDVLAYRVPLPPLAEQARIVARLDGAAERLERRAAAAKAVEAELDATLRAAFRMSADGRSVRLGELLTLRPTDTTVLPHETYQFAGVYSFARGVFRSVVKKGSETSYQYLTRLTKGDFVYPKLMAWEGALGIVPGSCDGCYVSPEFPVFSVDTNRVAPEILELHFRDPANWPTSTGTNVRRKRVKPEEFLNLQIPLPDPGAQATLAAACRKAKAALAAQRAATEHLDKLLPAMLHEAFGETASAEPLAAE